MAARGCRFADGLVRSPTLSFPHYVRHTDRFADSTISVPFPRSWVVHSHRRDGAGIRSRTTADGSVARRRRDPLPVVVGEEAYPYYSQEEEAEEDDDDDDRDGNAVSP